MRPKVSSERIHARRRAMQRFGVQFGKGRNAQAVRLIQSGAAKFVERTSNRVTVWDVDMDGQSLRVAYDAKRKVIVTVMRVTGEQKGVLE